jgi:hypothetical protein
MNSMFEMVEQQTRDLSRDFNPHAGTEEDELWKEYMEEKEQFMKEAEEFQELDQPFVAGTRDIRLPGAFDGWNEQLRQIEELKNHPVYKDMVFPFLAVDPAGRELQIMQGQMWEKEKCLPE